MTWPQTRTHLINRQRARCSRFAAAARREEDPYPSWIFDRRATQPQRQSGATQRACFKIRKGAAAGDFGCGQGGEVRASPQRAVRAEPTQAAGKRPAARRVFAEKAAWLRCSSVEDPPGIFSFVAPRHPAFSAKTAPFLILKQA